MYMRSMIVDAQFWFSLSFWITRNIETDLPSILLTQPCDTRSCREMSQGLTPWWASSTIRCRTTSGKGRPLTNTPPSWLTPPWPERKEGAIRSLVIQNQQNVIHVWYTYINTGFPKLLNNVPWISRVNECTQTYFRSVVENTSISYIN